MKDTVSVKVTQASLNQTALDWTQNMANHYAAIDIAVEEGSDIVLMPELSLTGYEVNDDFQRIDNLKIYKLLTNIAAYAHAKDPQLMVSVGTPWRLPLRKAFEDVSGSNPHLIKNSLYDRLNKPFNVQTLIAGGRVVNMTAKTNLFVDERGYEGRYFNEWSARDAEEYAQLAGIDYSYGTIPATLPDDRVIPFGTPITYVADDDGNAFVHAAAICETKWAMSRYDGYPHNDSRYEKFNHIPSIADYLGEKEGLFLEISNASPPSRLKQDKHVHLNNLASQYADVVVDTDGLGNSGSSFAQAGHRLISQDGETISASARLEFGQLATTTSVVTLQKANPDLQHKVHGSVPHKFKSPNASPDTKLIWEVDEKNAWDHPDNPDRWIEERVRNQALWTYDYIRKVGSTVAVNASSGGQDSGYNITVDYLAILMAMDRLGVEGVCDDMRVPYKEDVMQAFESGGKESAIEEFMSHYLVMYYFPTNNNSEEHENGARTLSEGGIDANGNSFKGLGGRFYVRNIQDLVTMCALVFGAEDTTKITPERMTKLMAELSDFVHADPSKNPPEAMKIWADRLLTEYPEMEEVTSVALPGQSIAYENFQARIRSVLIWAGANVHKGMPRANPNLSEGYTNNTTAAGDLQGGAINPNGGLFKDDEQAILQYLEHKGLHSITGPIKALSVINGNKPTAGLLPMQEGEVTQNDEDTMQATMAQITIMARLMHHDKIETEYGSRDRHVDEVYAATRDNDAFDDLDDNQLFNTVANFYRRWYSGQFKIHMATIQATFGENIDHQTSRRTPNLNGGSRDEVVQLGIDLMHIWAADEGLNWSDENRETLIQRSLQDKLFVKEFYNEMANKESNAANMTYDLRGLYTQIKQNGWEGVFTPLPDNHYINVVQDELKLRAA